PHRHAVWLWAAPMAFLSRFYRNSSRSPSRAPRDERGSHPILSVFELERLLYTGKTACNHADEVWPGLYLGDQDIASNRRELLQLRITHAPGAPWHSWVLSRFVTGISWLCCVPAGRILVHCAVGVSRSATLVLAYLMIRHHMPLVEAIKTVKDHRGIIPNRGFLRQLVALDNALRLKRSS
ncbi:DUS26 phosphatase, partial [Oriolus oriolus]|nr:DUS26 phosphatase [Oriolus oriolus]